MIVKNYIKGLFSRFVQTKCCVRKNSTAKYCLELVRSCLHNLNTWLPNDKSKEWIFYDKKHDFENYLCTLLLHKNIRRTGFAIRAFNIEIATLQDQISDMKIGEMRFKFWETSLIEIYKNKIPKHPVLIELYTATKTQKLSIIYLKRLITSRENYMLNSSLKTIEDLETYAENSVSPVYYLFLEAMGIKDITIDHAVSHLGKCQGIVNIIRGIPYNSKSGRISIPQDILLKYKVSYENIIRNSSEQNVRDAIYELASRANSHLMKARKLEKEGNKRIKSIYLPFVPLHLYLEKLRKADFNVFDEKLQTRNNLLPMKLLWHKIVG